MTNRRNVLTLFICKILVASGVSEGDPIDSSLDPVPSVASTSLYSNTVREKDSSQTFEVLSNGSDNSFLMVLQGEGSDQGQWGDQCSKRTFSLFEKDGKCFLKIEGHAIFGTIDPGQSGVRRDQINYPTLDVPIENKLALTHFGFFTKLQSFVMTSSNLESGVALYRHGHFIDLVIFYDYGNRYKYLISLSPIGHHKLPSAMQRWGG